MQVAVSSLSPVSIHIWKSTRKYITTEQLFESYKTVLFNWFVSSLFLFARLLVRSLARSFVGSFVRSFVGSFVRWSFLSSVRPSVRLSVPNFVCSFVRSLVRYAFVLSFVWSVALCSLARSHARSFVCSLAGPFFVHTYKRAKWE